MVEVIMSFLFAGISFLFMLYAIFMILVKKKKTFKFPLLISLILFISIGSFAVYRTITKTYNKVINESDDFIVKGVGKTGAFMGKAATAFGKSAYDGSGKVLKSQTILSKRLKEKGIEVGKIVQTENNVLQVYLVFNEDFKDNITIKVKNLDNEEVGRASNYVENKKRKAEYIEFLFSPITDIQNQSKIFIE